MNREVEDIIDDYPYEFDAYLAKFPTDLLEAYESFLAATGASYGMFDNLYDRLDPFEIKTAHPKVKEELELVYLRYTYALARYKIAQHYAVLSRHFRDYSRRATFGQYEVALPYPIINRSYSAQLQSPYYQISDSVVHMTLQIQPKKEFVGETVCIDFCMPGTFSPYYQVNLQVSA